MNEREALFRAIVDNPDDDTVRLVFADYLGGQDARRVECPKCKGSGRFCRGCNNSGVWDHSYFLDMSEEEIEQYGRPTSPCPNCKEPARECDECETCEGRGTVLDTTDADLAEFIRVQIAYYGAPVHREPDMTYCEFSQLKERADSLLAAHPEWVPKSMPCPGCEKWAKGFSKQSNWNECQVCEGTGDLLQPFGEGAKPRPLSLHRGLTLRVKCHWNEVMREREVCWICGQRLDRHRYCDRCDATRHQYRLTPWAEAFYAECLKRERVPEFDVGNEYPNGIPSCLTKFMLVDGTSARIKPFSKALNEWVHGQMRKPIPERK